MENNYTLETIGNQSKPPVITLTLSSNPNREGRSQVEILFECLNSFKDMYTDELLVLAQSGDSDSYDFKKDLCELESLNKIIADLFTAAAKANRHRPDTGFSNN